MGRGMRDMGLDIGSMVADVFERRRRKRLRREVTRETINETGRATLKRINAELRAHGLSAFRTVEQAVRAANARELPLLTLKEREK